MNIHFIEEMGEEMKEHNIASIENICHVSSTVVNARYIVQPAACIWVLITYNYVFDTSLSSMKFILTCPYNTTQIAKKELALL